MDYSLLNIYYLIPILYLSNKEKLSVITLNIMLLLVKVNTNKNKTNGTNIYNEYKLFFFKFLKYI